MGKKFLFGHLKDLNVVISCGGILHLKVMLGVPQYLEISFILLKIGS